jgi:hypothetical protein
MPRPILTAHAPFTTTSLPNAAILPLFMFNSPVRGVLRCLVGGGLLAVYAYLVQQGYAAAACVLLLPAGMCQICG